MGNNKVCGFCETEKSYAQYHKSPTEKNKYLPICKLCCNKKMKHYKEITGSDLAALWLVLSELGVPVFADVLHQVEITMATANSNTDVVNVYLRCLSESGRLVHGFWESDVMLDMLIDGLIDRSKENETLNIEEQQIIWGKYLTEDGQIDIDAYNFLNQTMEDYTGSIEQLDANTEKRFRDLCRCELRLRKANESGDGNEISKAQDSLNKQLGLLSLDNFKKQYVSEEKRFCEKRIALIEHTKPAECEDLKKYIDIVGYEREKAIPMRAIRNAIAGTREYPDIPVEEQ